VQHQVHVTSDREGLQHLQLRIGQARQAEYGEPLWQLHHLRLFA